MSEKRLYLGRTAEGFKVYAEVGLGKVTNAPQSTITHERIEAGAPRVTVTFEVVNPRRPGRWESFGQTRPSDRVIVAEASPVLAAVEELWADWHLNDMQAGCAHQEVVYEDAPYYRPSLDATLPCPVTGYRYGSAWLHKPLNQRAHDLLAQIEAAKEDQA